MIMQSRPLNDLIKSKSNNLLYDISNGIINLDQVDDEVWQGGWPQRCGFINLVSGWYSAFITPVGMTSGHLSIDVDKSQTP